MYQVGMLWQTLGGERQVVAPTCCPGISASTLVSD